MPPLTRLCLVLFVLPATVEGKGDDPAFGVGQKVERDVEATVFGWPEGTDAQPTGVFAFGCKPDGVRGAFVGIGVRHNRFLSVNQTATLAAFHGNPK